MAPLEEKLNKYDLYHRGGKKDLTFKGVLFSVAIEYHERRIFSTLYDIMEIKLRIKKMWLIL